MLLRAISAALLLAGLALPALRRRCGGRAARRRRRPRRSPPRPLHGNLSLSLQEAIEMGLKNNLDLEVERHEPLIAAEDAEIAWGAYDPELYADAHWRTRRRRTRSRSISRGQIQQNTEQKGVEGTGGLRGLVPWLGADVRRLALQQPARDEQRDPVALAGDALGRALQPQASRCCAGLIWNEPWTRVKVSRILHEADLENFRTQVMDTVRDIEGAYWNLIANEEQLRVAEKSLETAKALLEQTKTQYEVGVVSKVEVTEAEAGVAAREFSRITRGGHLPQRAGPPDRSRARART